MGSNLEVYSSKTIKENKFLLPTLRQKARTFFLVQVVLEIWSFSKFGPPKIFSIPLELGWPTSQMLRATFLSVFQQKAISYTRNNDHINITAPLTGTQCFYLVRLVVYRPVSSVGNGIAIDTDGLGFAAWNSQRGHSAASTAMVLWTSKLCYTGAKPQQWACHLLHASSHFFHKVISLLHDNALNALQNTI